MKSKLERLFLTAKQVYSEKLRHRSVKGSDSFNEYLPVLNESGVVVLDGYYNNVQCENIINDIDEAFARYPQYLWTDNEGADNRIHGSENTAESIMQYHADPLLLGLANAFNETPTRCFSTLAAKLVEAPNNLGSGGGWHRDTAMETKQFKAILYLTDVTIDNGPFQYLEGTNKAGSLYKAILKANIDYAQNRLSDDEVERIMDMGGYQLHTFTARAGTVLLVNTFGIHRGMPLINGARYALTNYYFTEAFLHNNTEAFNKKFNKITAP